ncbi:MAG: hypothetical protein M0018_01100 [Nitrospiraceae bacterium]|nr:hypothetical protein [Nitrospiraceae bacterium]
MAKIKDVTSTSPVEIHLKDGEVLKVQIKSIEDGKLLIEQSNQRGALFVEWTDVESINPPPSKWTGNITVETNDHTGNTHISGASISFDASRRTVADRIQAQTPVLNYDSFFTKKFYGCLE